MYDTFGTLGFDAWSLTGGITFSTLWWNGLARRGKIFSAKPSLSEALLAALGALLVPFRKATFDVKILS